MQIHQTKPNYPYIPPIILLYLAWRNLATKRLRSLLTIAGIVIGVGSIFFLLSLGLGLQNLVSEQLIGSTSVKSIDITSPNSRILKLDREVSQKISNLSHVASIGNSISLPGSLKYNGSEVDTIVYGISTDYQNISNLTPIKGNLLTKEDYKAVVINKIAAEAIGIKDLSNIVDQKIQILIPLQPNQDNDKNEINEEFTIKGVIDSGNGKEVFIPISIFSNDKDQSYSQIKILADSTENISPLRMQIESLGYQTASPIDAIDQVNQVFKYFNMILVAFGAIGMIVAVLGMFNTLTISLLERTKEIGLMFAMGARQRDMHRLFFLEAILLSIIGSISGIILASGVGQIINLVMNRMAKDRGVTQNFNLFATPWWLILLTVMFMVLIGSLVVMMPAKRAQKINPIDALRRE